MADETSSGIVENDTNKGNIAENIEDILATYLNKHFVEDGNIIGYFDDPNTFNEIVQRMKEKGFSYSVRDSDIRKKLKSNVGEVGESLKNDFGQATVFYQLKVMSIKFFGLPFTVEKTTHYQCAYGRKYYKSRAGQLKAKSGDVSCSLPMKKRRNIISKKMGCLAKMTLKKIVVYPEYSLEVESDWRKKKKKIECLRKDLSDKSKLVESFCRYYLSASLQSSHNHPPMMSYVCQTPSKGKKLHKSNGKCRRKDSEKTELKTVQWEPSYTTEEILEPQAANEIETDSITMEDSHFLSTLVKFPAQTYEGSELKPIAIGLEINGMEQGETRTFQIQAIQYQPTPQDMQLLFRDKLKRLYTLSENCFNSDLLLRLVGELEHVELAIQNDIGYDANAV